jgi:hypothetical protein
MAKVITGAFLFVHLLAFTVSPRAAEPPDTATYGAKQKFSVDRTLHFPEFDLTYVGKRRVTPPQYPRGWWTYDFKVRGKSGEQTVSWSAGTGDIGPARFKVDNAEFQIELSRSDKLGPLREGELVVSPVK